MSRAEGSEPGHAGRWERIVAGVATPAGAGRANLAVLVIVLAGTLIGWGALWLEDRANPPTCHGIGWGCTPDPATSVALIGMVVLLPVFVVSTVSIWLGSVLARSEGRRRHLGAVLVLTPVAVHVVALTALQLAVLLELPGWINAIT